MTDDVTATAVGATSSRAVSPRMAVLGQQYRWTTIGILLVISAAAFEGMGVGTAMPAIMGDIGTPATYAWPFVAFLAASVFATVVGGRWADRRGPRWPLVTGVLTFAVGLVVSGLSATLAPMLVGRALQGFGGGLLTVAIFVLVALVYPVSLRPAVFAWTASAWVLPSLIGPPVAAFVTKTWSWHWVFLGIAPVAVVALVMVSRALRRLEAAPVTTDRRGGAGLVLVLAALGAAAGVAALSWAGERADLAVLPIALVALAVLVPCLLRLVPRGTLWAARGVSSAVLSRGLLAGSFFAANAFLPLVLTDLHEWPLERAGAMLIAGSLGWSAASAWQGGRPDLPRHVLLRIGATLVAVGIAVQIPIALTLVSGWFALPAQAIAGLGMGLGMSSVALLVMGHSGEGEVGFNTAAAQILDGLSTALLIGVGGALTALLALAGGLPWLLGGLVGVVLVVVVIAPRTALPRTPVVVAVSDAA